MAIGLHGGEAMLAIIEEPHAEELAFIEKLTRYHGRD